MLLRLTSVGVWLGVLLVSAGSVRSVSAETGLVEAVKKGDSLAVLALLQQHVDVNEPAPDGTTALYWAVQRSNPRTVEDLIRAGANVNSASRYGIAPLHVACLNGSAVIIRVLLEAGANANASTPDGETALMTAARTGVADGVEALLGHGADVNAQERWRGQTALMWAAGEGHVETIRALISHGAAIGARSNGGWTPLLFAAREGRIEAVRALLDLGADVNETLLAQEDRRPGPADAAVPAQPTGGPSALQIAVGSKHYELAAVLLERGADPNAAGPGWTSLHQLSWMRKPGQGSNHPGPTGSGTMDSLALIRRLVAKGAEVDGRVTRQPRPGTTALNMLGGTAFFLAARTGDAPMMRLLAELGANPLLPNEDGTTPLMAAAGVGTHSPGEDPGTEAEALEAAKVALELGADVNVVDKNGNTAMHGAAFKQLPAVVKLLAERGAKIEIWNKKNLSGWTPLRIAVGVHRGMNFRFSLPTADALREVMTAARVSTEVEPEPVVSGATVTK